MTQREANKRARLGGKYLDSRFAAWALSINKETLSIPSGSDCILGQLGGGCYLLGIKRADCLNTYERERLGFTIFDGRSGQNFDRLRLAWIGEINRRLK
jgi:hypothetical protein